MPAKINLNKENLSLETFICKLPSILDETDVLSEAFFDKLKKIVIFDTCKVYFLSIEGLTSVYPVLDSVKISDNSVIKALFDEKYETLDLLTTNNHFLTYLNVKGAVYGILLFEKSYFSDTDKLMLKSVAKLVSYKIKDKELTDIIRTQLSDLTKALSTSKKTEKFKTNFIANFSHELRTPLNSIIGFSELLKNPKVGNLNEKQASYVLDIHKSALHLLEMINDMLDISKIESNSIQLLKSTFDINQVISEVTNILYPLLEEKNIKLVKNIENITICADYQKLKQILFNLLSNAIKYTNDEIKIDLSKENKNIILKIKDNGVGIDKKYHKKIFNKYTQLNNSSRIKENSTGLGLTITKEFVKLHGGTIRVESEVSKGSEFIIMIPVLSVI